MEMLEVDNIMTKENRAYKRELKTTNNEIAAEDTLAAYFTFKLTMDEEVQDFYLISNKRYYGVFRYILYVKSKSSIETLAINTSYFENDTNQFSKVKREAVKFNLNRCFESFKKISHPDFRPQNLKCILYTNLEFHENFNFDLELDHQLFKVLNVTNEERPLHNLGLLDCQIYKLQLVNPFEIDESEIEDYQKFFEIFYVYKNSFNIQNLVARMKSVLYDTFSCDFDCFKLCTDFIENWLKNYGGRQKLSKSFVKMKIVEFLLSPYIRGMSGTEQLGTSNLLQNAILNFDIALVENIDQAKTILGNTPTNSMLNYDTRLPSNLELKWTDSTEESNYKLEIKKPNKKSDCTIIAVEVPRSYRKKIYAIIKFSKSHSEKLKFLLIDDIIDSDQFKEWKIFKFLKDLDKETEIYQKITNNFQIKLQGRDDKISLRSLIEKDVEVETLITINDLAQMAKEEYLIGETAEPIPEFYIKTYLSEITIGVDAIISLTFTTNDVLIISCNGKLASIKPRLHMLTIIEISHYLLPEEEIKEIDKLRTLTLHGYDSKFVLITNSKCTEEEFTQICNKDPKRNYHHLQVTKKENLEWLKSKGSVKKLRQYQLKNGIPKSNLFNYTDNKLRVICGLSGVGKSFMVNYLKKSHPSTFWIHKINLEEQNFYFEEDLSANETLQFILNCKTNYCYNQVELLVRKRFETNKNIVIMWDGLDKLSSNSLNGVLRAIEQITSLGFVQWITARNYMKPMLENRFNTIAFEICGFNEKEQKKYIETKLRPILMSDNWAMETDEYKVQAKIQFEIVISKIMDKIWSMQDNGQIGIPLLLHLLTELSLFNARNKLNLVEEASLFDIYTHFVTKQFSSIFPNNQFPQALYDELKNQRLSQYEIASMKIWFDDETLFPHLNCNQFLNNIKKNKDPIGIISHVTINCKPVFAQSTFSEYFTASFLRNDLKNLVNLKERIFSTKFKNIRFFLDLALTNDKCYAHQAVLYKNFDLLKENQNTLHQKDIAGRSPLHIAVSYGEKHPLLKIDYKIFAARFLVDTELGVEDDSEFQRIVKYLSSRLDVFEVDQLWNLNCMQYADELLCLSSLESLLESNGNKLNLKDFMNYRDNPTAFYFSTRYNYEHLFQLFSSQAPTFLIERSSGRSLLHLAAKFNRYKFLKWILERSNRIKFLNRNYIDLADANKETALHLAAQKGHIQCVQLLVKEGANVNNFNKSKLTPLHAATITGHLEVVEFLTKSTAKVNVISKSGQTPLHIAARNGHVAIAEFLIHNKSKLEASDNHMWKPLHMASNFANPDITRTLIKSGAKIDATEKNGFTPLHLAAQSGHIDIVKQLIDNGANINLVAGYKWTALYMAINANHFDVVSLLIKSGANTEVQEVPLLHFAVKYMRGDIVKWLVENDPIINLDAKSSLVRNSKQSRSFLMKNLKKISPHKISKHSEISPLQIATENNDLDMIKFLIQKGASINHKDADGNTLLYIAARNNFCSIVELLINAGADVTALNSYGWSSLHTAAKHGHIEVVKILLKNGASVNCIENKCYTPLHIATLMEHIEIIKILTEFGANLNALDRNGLTCLELAKMYNKHYSIAVLKTCANEELLTSSRNNGFTKSRDEASDKPVRHSLP